jgi:hypothetical protein
MEREYETNLIVDCYGQERLDEYLGQGRLSLVLVCIVEGGVLTQAPGGRDNALMVSLQLCIMRGMVSSCVISRLHGFLRRSRKSSLIV